MEDMFRGYAGNANKEGPGRRALGLEDDLVGVEDLHVLVHDILVDPADLDVVVALVPDFLDEQLLLVVDEPADGQLFGDPGEADQVPAQQRVEAALEYLLRGHARLVEGQPAAADLHCRGRALLQV
jgi:hypothetical protein